MKGWLSRAGWACTLLVLGSCHAGIRITARPQITIRTAAQVRIQATAHARAQTAVAVEMEGAAEPEFFGIPLGDAQDIVFVLDRSGSMDEYAQGRMADVHKDDGPTTSPRKIDVAQAELLEALQRLPEGTRLNVIFFDQGLEGFAQQSVALEPKTRDDLIAFVKATVPYGSTALAPALRTAFLMNAPRVVLLSDGLGNVGGDSEDILRDAREAMLGDVRIDTIGLGPDQDRILLETLAAESGGIYQRL